MAEKYGIAQTYRIYDDLLSADIDAVVIATPMHLHVSQALKALEAGILPRNSDRRIPL